MEEAKASELFQEYVQVSESNEIMKDELKSILLNLNLNVNMIVLDDYMEVFHQLIGGDSNRSGELYTWE